MQPQATQTPPPPVTEPEPPAPMPGPPAGPAPGAPTPPPPATPSKAGYAKKRPLWQWVLIYVVLAAIIYGIVWYFWIRKSGTTTGY